MPRPELATGDILEQAHDSSLFFERHHESLGVLFDTLQMPQNALRSLPEAVAVTQLWTHGDHTQPAYSLLLDKEQDTTLRELFDDFGLLDEKSLPAGHYFQTLMLGGKQAGNNRRLAAANRALTEGSATTGRLVLLGGQRLLEPDEKSVIENNLSALADKPTSDSWAKKAVQDSSRLQWETDGVRLAAANQLGPLALKRLYLRLENTDPIDRYEMEWSGLPVTLMHSLAVSRPNGSPRHTTESCMGDWVELMQPPQGAKVAFIAGNPHIERTVRSAQAALKAVGRPDIELVGAGSAAAPGQDVEIFLGEIARNLYEDLRASA